MNLVGGYQKLSFASSFRGLLVALLGTIALVASPFSVIHSQQPKPGSDIEVTGTLGQARLEGIIPITGAPNPVTRPIEQTSARSPTVAEPRKTIGLEDALALAGIENPTIARADNVVQATLAEQMQARSLLFPSLSAGANLRIHRGNLLSGRGIIRDVNTQSLYWGAGADAKGGGTVAVPGIRVFSQLTDAIYAPQVARYRVFEATSDAIAIRHFVLLDVGSTYLELVGAQARLAALAQSQNALNELVKLTANFAKTGQGREADAQRARSESLLLETEVERVQEEVAVASAALSRLLHLDPAARLEGEDSTPPVIELVDCHLPLEQLIQTALVHHPEIEARTAEVAVNEAQYRAEKVRPWLPTISVGFSAGEFGGGGNNTASRFGNFNPRTDLDVYAVWSLQNLGVSNRALQHRARAEIAQAEAGRFQVINRVRREVSDAYTLTLTRRQQMDLARKRVETAQNAYRQDLLRTRNVEGRPLEVLNSINLLVAAQQDLIRAMVGYSQAQLQLFVALGRNPTLLADGPNSRSAR